MAAPFYAPFGPGALTVKRAVQPPQAACGSVQQGPQAVRRAQRAWLSGPPVQSQGYPQSPGYPQSNGHLSGPSGAFPPQYKHGHPPEEPLMGYSREYGRGMPAGGPRADNAKRTDRLPDRPSGVAPPTSERTVRACVATGSAPATAGGAAEAAPLERDTRSNRRRQLQKQRRKEGKLLRLQQAVAAQAGAVPPEADDEGESDREDVEPQLPPTDQSHADHAARPTVPSGFSAAIQAMRSVALAQVNETWQSLQKEVQVQCLIWGSILRDGSNGWESVLSDLGSEESLLKTLLQAGVERGLAEPLAVPPELLQVLAADGCSGLNTATRSAAETVLKAVEAARGLTDLADALLAAASAHGGHREEDRKALELAIANCGISLPPMLWWQLGCREPGQNLNREAGDDTTALGSWSSGGAKDGAYIKGHTVCKVKNTFLHIISSDSEDESIAASSYGGSSQRSSSVPSRFHGSRLPDS